MTPDAAGEMYRRALVQAVIDSDLHPDGPFLSERFWTLCGLFIEDLQREIQERADAAVYSREEQWHERA